MTADHMYSCHNGEKFTLQVPMQLSSKPKTLSQLVIAVWNLDKLFSVLKKSITFIPSIFPELLISKKVVTWKTESSCFRTPFWSEHVKSS